MQLSNEKSKDGKPMQLKLTKEEAQKLLQALQNEEQKTNKKMQRQQQKSNGSKKEKDW